MLSTCFCFINVKATDIQLTNEQISFLFSSLKMIYFDGLTIFPHLHIFLVVKCTSIDNSAELSCCEGLYTPFIYIYEKAVQDAGVSKSTASIVLSVLGVSNSVGRLAVGLLADRPWADSVLIHNVAAITAGLLTCLVSIIFSFELLCVYAALFGGLVGKCFVYLIGYR